MSITHKKKKAFQSIYKDSDISEPGIEIFHDAKPPELTPNASPDDEDDRRIFPRHPIEFEAIIFHKGVSFRTKTINISIGGCLLPKSIPIDFVKEEFDIVLNRMVGKNREYYLVKGMALGAPFRSPRIKFTQMEEIQKKKLEELFAVHELEITKKIVNED